MKLYGAVTLTGEIDWCRFRATRDFLTVQRMDEIDFRRDPLTIRVSLREWITGKPNAQKGGRQ